jgi:hypothetical protein
MGTYYPSRKQNRNAGIVSRFVFEFCSLIWAELGALYVDRYQHVISISILGFESLSVSRSTPSQLNQLCLPAELYRYVTRVTAGEELVA